MDQPIIKGVLIGVGLFLLVGVLTIGIIAYNIGQDSSKSSTQELTSITTDMQEQKYLIYDNMELSGSSVMNAIKKMENDGNGQKISILVQTGSAASYKDTWYYNTFSGGTPPNGVNIGFGNGGELQKGGTVETNLNNAYDVSAQQYINPTGQFRGYVYRDKNNAIRAVVFSQK